MQSDQDLTCLLVEFPESLEYINPCHVKWIKMPHPLLIISQSDYLIQTVDLFAYLMTNSADPDQLASSEANWFGSKLFAKAGHIQVQQDQAK